MSRPAATGPSTNALDVARLVADLIGLVSQGCQEGQWAAAVTSSVVRRSGKDDRRDCADYFFAILSSLTPNEVVSISGSPV